MFTGIIESLGQVVSLEKQGTNIKFRISSSLTPELKVDQSLSHNGVCLTVTEKAGSEYAVVAVEETLKKTTLGQLKSGDFVNLERSMPANGRFDGHVVQGHVDQKAICVSREEKGGSWIFKFSFEKNEELIVEKGSICVNGISLTVFDCNKGSFSVSIIPYTFEHTTLKYLYPGQEVNIEFDVLGKYIKNILEKRFN
ncbi:MAG: riboflavin synthase [Cytophagaceae bacterium]